MLFLRLTLCIGLLVVAASDAMAWRNNRNQQWEAMFDIHYQNAETIDGKDGGSVEFQNDLGWGFGFGYNLNKHFNIGLNFNFTNMDYKARVFVDDEATAAVERVEKRFRHKASHYAFHIDATYHLLVGSVTPLLQIGIGSAEIDSNISNGPGYSSCWYDPLYGYICNNYYSSYSASGLSLRAGAGMRWDFGNGAFLKAVYSHQYLDLNIDSGDPEFDSFALQIGSKY